MTLKRLKADGKSLILYTYDTHNILTVERIYPISKEFESKLFIDKDGTLIIQTDDNTYEKYYAGGLWELDNIEIED